MSSQVDASLHSHEVADMATFFDKVHKAEEEQLSHWPLDDEPLLWFVQKAPNEEPDWNTDPSHFSLLWRAGCRTPVRVTGPHIQTNLFGRTAAEAFADFPTDFEDSPPSSPSLSLSPVSPLFSPSSLGEENSGKIPTNELPDASVDEMSQQLSDRVHLESPPQSPHAVSISHDTPPPPSPTTCNPLFTNSLSDTLGISDDSPPPPPSSPPTCDPLSLNFLSDAFSSSSGTLSVGTSSKTSSTYAVSPSPKPLSTSSASSPSSGLRRSPRISPPPTIPQMTEEPGEQFNGGVSTRNLQIQHPLTQIILEEQPMEAATRRRRNAKRSGSYEDDDDFESMMDDVDPRPRKKVIRAASKRHPCTIPGCTESFTRPNDVLRHVKNAAIHKGSTQQAEALAASSTVCKYCGEELSRADAARRHELKASCGKRTIRRKSTYSMLPA